MLAIDLTRQCPALQSTAKKCLLWVKNIGIIVKTVFLPPYTPPPHTSPLTHTSPPTPYTPLHAPPPPLLGGYVQCCLK